MNSPLISRKVGEAILTSSWLIELLAVSDISATIAISTFEFGVGPDPIFESVQLQSKLEVSVDEMITIDDSLSLRLAVRRIHPDGALFTVFTPPNRLSARLEVYELYRRAEPSCDLFESEKMSVAETEEAVRGFWQEFRSIPKHWDSCDDASNNGISTHYRIDEVENEDGTIDDCVVVVQDELDKKDNVKRISRSEALKFWSPERLAEARKQLGKYLTS